MREAPFLGLPKARESLNAPLLTVDLHASSLWSPTSNLNQPAWHHKSFSQWTARSNFTTESAGLTERPEPEIQYSGKRYISITIIFSSRSNDFPLGLSMRVNVLVACVKTICACCERASTAFFARHERTRREREWERGEREANASRYVARGVAREDHPLDRQQICSLTDCFTWTSPKQCRREPRVKASRRSGRSSNKPNK